MLASHRDSLWISLALWESPSSSSSFSVIISPRPSSSILFISMSTLTQHSFSISSSARFFILSLIGFCISSSPSSSIGIPLNSPPQILLCWELNHPTLLISLKIFLSLMHTLQNLQLQASHKSYYTSQKLLSLNLIAVTLSRL